MNRTKRAFTLTEIIVATLLIAVSALMALTLYNTAHDTNQSAEDTFFLELAQINVFEQLQQSLDMEGDLGSNYDYELEAGRFIVRTRVIIDQFVTSTGKPYFLVHATSRIGGTNARKLTSTTIMTQQTGVLYDAHY